MSPTYEEMQAARRARQARAERVARPGEPAQPTETGISNDDPQAVAKLQERLRDLRDNGTAFRAVNRALRESAGASREDQAEAIKGAVKAATSMAAEFSIYTCLQLVDRGGVPRADIAKNVKSIRAVRDQLALLGEQVQETQAEIEQEHEERSRGGDR